MLISGCSLYCPLSKLTGMPQYFRVNIQKRLRGGAQPSQQLGDAPLCFFEVPLTGLLVSELRSRGE
jgi:hypothetical protein